MNGRPACAPAEQSLRRVMKEMPWVAIIGLAGRAGNPAGQAPWVASDANGANPPHPGT